MWHEFDAHWGCLLTSPPLLRAKLVVYCKLNVPSIFWVIVCCLRFTLLDAEHHQCDQNRKCAPSFAKSSRNDLWWSLDTNTKQLGHTGLFLWFGAIPRTLSPLWVHVCLLWSVHKTGCINLAIADAGYSPGTHHNIPGELQATIQLSDHTLGGQHISRHLPFSGADTKNVVASISVADTSIKVGIWWPKMPGDQQKHYALFSSLDR